MKRTITLGILLLFAVAAFPQTQLGFHLVGAVGLNNVNRKPQMLTVEGEFGYFGKVLGLTATANTVAQKHFTKAASVGLKGYAKVFTVDALAFHVFGEVDRFTKEIDKNITSPWSYKGGAQVSFPILPRFDAGFDVHEFIYKQKWDGVNGTRYKTGARFSVAYRL